MRDGVEMAVYHRCGVDVALDEAESVVAGQPLENVTAAGGEVVQGDNLVAPTEERPTQVGSEKADATSHENPHAATSLVRFSNAGVPVPE